MTVANLIKLFLNSDCDKPVDESNADIAGGSPSALAQTNSGAAMLATVDDTTPPDDSFTGGKSSWWRGQSARLVQKRQMNEIGRRRILAQRQNRTSSTIPLAPEEAGVKVSP